MQFFPFTFFFWMTILLFRIMYWSLPLSMFEGECVIYDLIVFLLQKWYPCDCGKPNKNQRNLMNMLFFISYDFLGIEVYFVTYWNGSTSLFLRFICVKFFQVLILRKYTSLMLRYITCKQQKNGLEGENHLQISSTIS